MVLWTSMQLTQVRFPVWTDSSVIGGPVYWESLRHAKAHGSLNGSSLGGFYFSFLGVGEGAGHQSFATQFYNTTNVIFDGYCGSWLMHHTWELLSQAHNAIDSATRGVAVAPCTNMFNLMSVISQAHSADTLIVSLARSNELRTTGSARGILSLQTFSSSKVTNTASPVLPPLCWNKELNQIILIYNNIIMAFYWSVMKYLSFSCSYFRTTLFWVIWDWSISMFKTTRQWE